MTNCVSVSVLKKRSDFLHARQGSRAHERAFVLQLVKRKDEKAKDGLRIGYTVTKKVGNAVVRNRIKRRLRAAVRQAIIPEQAMNRDAVIIARDYALSAPFGDLVEAVGNGLVQALKRDAKHNLAKSSTSGQNPRSGKNNG